MAYSIELDCAPGYPRPGHLLPDVLEGTGVTLDADEPQSMFFGEWTWVIPADQEAAYKLAQPVIKERIIALYNDGFIRYGSW